jgi:acetoin utilization deacetylase AcuC-like enzyme
MDQSATASSSKLQAIPVFYSEGMLADANSFSPSAGKPRQVIDGWRKAGLELDLQSFAPATTIDFYLAHDPAYVDAVLAGKRPNGFGNYNVDVACSLPHTTGAMIAAARAALAKGCACAPVSGFHHANYDTGGGFCTFNGLVVTAQKLIADAGLQHVLILDCDMHYGDGTDQIIEKRGLSARIQNDSFGRWFDTPSDAPAYLEKLRDTAETFDHYDLVLYQAGADVHIDDPLGGVLTTAQMLERDRIVFEAARRAAVPIAWNLAGGYQKPLSRVIELHVNTMRVCARAYRADEMPEAKPARPDICVRTKVERKPMQISPLYT